MLLSSGGPSDPPGPGGGNGKDKDGDTGAHLGGSDTPGIDLPGTSGDNAVDPGADINDKMANENSTGMQNI